MRYHIKYIANYHILYIHLIVWVCLRLDESGHVIGLLISLHGELQNLNGNKMDIMLIELIFLHKRSTTPLIYKPQNI